MDMEYIQQLPESILLKIFHLCSFKSLGHTSMVCRQWRRIAYDQSLWREADLRGLNLTTRRCLTLIDRISSYVKTMNLNGCALTVSLIASVAEKCVNLKSLSLQGAHFTDLTHDFRLGNQIFPSLQNLDLRFLYGDDCKVFVSILNQLTGLQCLGMDNVSSPGELEKIFLKLSSLRIVHCQNCSSFTDTHVNILTNCCPGLESLCLTGCIYVTGSSFPRLLNQCKRLQTLLLSCTRVRNQNLMGTDWSQTSLTELDISYCYGIAETGLMEMLPKLTGIRYLQLSFCGWGRALSDDVMNAMSENQYEQLHTLDIHSSFNITGEMLCKFVRKCSGLNTLCVGSAITSNEELEGLLKSLPNLKNFYITKQATIKTETVFMYIRSFCQHIKTLALYNFYAINKNRVEEAMIELVLACKSLRVLCIRGTNVPLRTELANMANKVKKVAKRCDIEISRKPHFLLSGAKVCLDSAVKSSAVRK
ncbi:F-box/LRR-repeat protein 20-like [Montipora capricornis]|uniref:F-box/LRR-repeat protein 20-like n=1 Tax=Montipora capricornis TaxID=246305 RepID=UPI0035F15052